MKMRCSARKTNCVVKVLEHVVPKCNLCSAAQLWKKNSSVFSFSLSPSPLLTSAAPFFVCNIFAPSRCPSLLSDISCFALPSVTLDCGISSRPCSGARPPRGLLPEPARRRQSKSSREASHLLLGVLLREPRVVSETKPNFFARVCAAPGLVHVALLVYLFFLVW